MRQGAEDLGQRILAMTHTFDKSRLPSRHVSIGAKSAPHRSYYYAMGMTEDEIARPFVAVVSAGNALTGTRSRGA